MTQIYVAHFIVPHLLVTQNSYIKWRENQGSIRVVVLNCDDSGVGCDAWGGGGGGDDCESPSWSALASLG